LAGTGVLLAAAEDEVVFAGKVPVATGGFTGVEVVPVLLPVAWFFPDVAFVAVDWVLPAVAFGPAAEVLAGDGAGVGAFVLLTGVLLPVPLLLPAAVAGVGFAAEVPFLAGDGVGVGDAFELLAPVFCAVAIVAIAVTSARI
jgi:hypothetical protein